MFTLGLPIYFFAFAIIYALINPLFSIKCKSKPKVLEIDLDDLEGGKEEIVQKSTEFD
jgi:hypothetical protein